MGMSERREDISEQEGDAPEQKPGRYYDDDATGYEVYEDEEGEKGKAEGERRKADGGEK